MIAYPSPPIPTAGSITPVGSECCWTNEESHLVCDRSRRPFPKKIRAMRRDLKRTALTLAGGTFAAVLIPRAAGAHAMLLAYGHGRQVAEAGAA